MEVPPELKNQYLQRRRQELKNCFSALEFANFFELEKVGHRLKGNGSTFGHEELSIIGSHLEKAAQTRDLTCIEKALKEFSSWLKRQPN